MTFAQVYTDVMHSKMDHFNKKDKWLSSGRVAPCKCRKQSSIILSFHKEAFSLCNCMWSRSFSLGFRREDLRMRNISM